MRLSFWLLVTPIQLVISQSIDRVEHNNAFTPSNNHGLSTSVQEALDQLRVIEKTSRLPVPSRSQSIYAFIWSLVAPKPTASLSTVAAGREDVFTRPVDILKEAADSEDCDAIFLLAEMSLHGNYTYLRNYRDATRYYTQLTELTSNLTALENLAFLHSSGLQGTDTDQGLAVMYHSVAAAQGSMRSQMALGYRYLNGIGVSPNCSKACEYYAAAAEAAIAWVHSGPPGGMYWSKKAYRYADGLGGLYGGIALRPEESVVEEPANDIDDVIDYYTYMAEKSDMQASFALGKLYRDGSKTVEQDFVRSLYWFRQVAKSYWTKDGKTVKNVKPLQHHAESAAYIATAYLRGEGTDQDFEKAKMWFQRGITLGDRTANAGFALMHLDGLGPIQRDVAKAEVFFKAAADNEHKGAQVSLGKILAARGDLVTASRLFESAARAGRAEPYFYLAQFSHHGIGREKNCAIATQYYKLVAESVETLQSTINYGNQAYHERRWEDALIGNLIAAETGYEIGQVNAAFLLDHHRRPFSAKSYLTSKLAPHLAKVKQVLGLPLNSANTVARTTSIQSPSDELALLYYTRSSSQQNIEALVKAGDFHLGGYGTFADPQKAVSLWSSAAETRSVPLALWNLGWSYENGVGVEQDFHLAKRYYDACLEANKLTYLPVSLSLIKLRARSAWNTMTGGSINSIRAEHKESELTWHSVWVGIKHFWRSQFDSGEIETSSNSQSAGPGTFIDEDYPTAEDDLYDTLFILAMCLLVIGVVYVRTTWWPQTRRHHGVGAQEQAPVGPNPHLAEWIVRVH